MDAGSITGIFRINNVLWTDNNRYALVILKKVQWPASSHMQIALQNVDEAFAKKKLTAESFDRFKQYLIDGKCNPRFETKMVSQLRLFHHEHSTITSRDVFYTLDFFPLFADNLHYELTLSTRQKIPRFLETLVGKHTPVQIKKIHGIYPTKGVPTQMILWSAAMQSDRSLRTTVKKKFTKLVEWDKLREKDVELVSQFREPRMNHRSKMFMRRVLADTIDSDTAKLVPWVRLSTLKLLSPLEKKTLVLKLQENIEAAFDFDFQIVSPNLFQLWFGHSPNQGFEDAIAFKARLRNHMHGICITGANKYITTVEIKQKQYIGSSGTIGLTSNKDTQKKLVHAMRNDVKRYREVIDRFQNSDIVLGTPAAPEGICIVPHKDDGIYWQQIADVDEYHDVRTVTHTVSMQDIAEVTLFNTHKFDFQHWIVLQKSLPEQCTVHICGRLDQYCTGKVGQVFRDLVTLRGYNKVPRMISFVTTQLMFVQGMANIPADVEQVFTSAWSKLPKEPIFSETWAQRTDGAKFTNRIWLTHPLRVRTIQFRNDAGRTVFVEPDEPQQRITNINRYERADLIPMHRWNGRLLNAAAYIPDPEKSTNFDLYSVRTFARKIYYVNMNTLPSDTGRLPSRRTLRHSLQETTI